MRAPSPTVAACMLTPCPTETLLPMEVSREPPPPPPLSLAEAVRMMVPSCMDVLSPTVILPASPGHPHATLTARNKLRPGGVRPAGSTCTSTYRYAFNVS